MNGISRKKSEKDNKLSLFVIFLSAQIVFYIINDDMYLQLSGSYIFILFAFIFGLPSFLKRLSKLTVQHLIVILCVVPSVAFSTVKSGVVERGYFLSYIFLIMLLMYFLTLPFSNREISWISKSYVTLALIASFCIIVFQKRFYADEADRISVQLFNNPIFDPNYLGATMVAPFFISAYYALENKRAETKALWIFIGLIIAFGVFMTGSRGAMVSLASGIAIIFFGKTFNKKNRKHAFKIILGLIVVVGIIMLMLPRQFYNRLFDFDSWLDSSNLRRFELWENAILSIIKKPLFGYGIGSTATLIGQPAHNTFLEVCVHLGLFGGVLLIYFFVYAIFSKNNLYVKAIAFSTLVWSIFVAAEMTLAFWLNISFCVLLTNIEKKKKVKNGKYNRSRLQRGEIYKRVR